LGALGATLRLLPRRVSPQQDPFDLVLTHALTPATLSAGRSVTLPDYAKLRRAPMQLLQAGVDTSVIALWLGNELKERALTRTALPSVDAPARYRPPDKLLAFLESL
jgi:integrase/recombinase XerD